MLNRVRRTQLARHAAQEVTTANLPRLDATLIDLVAYGELSYSGHLPTGGPALGEVKALIAELQTKGHLPHRPKRRAAAKSSSRDAVAL